MFWTDLPGSELVKRVFTSPPPIGRIDIFDLQLQRNGSALLLNFDLVDVLPDNPPVKWVKGFNRCRMGINCGGIKDLKILGWGISIPATIKIDKLVDSFLIEIEGKSFSLHASCSDIVITGPTVYVSS